MKYSHELGRRVMRKAWLGVWLGGALGVVAPVWAAGTPVYDLDGSGVVNAGDANMIKAAFGKCQGSAGYDARIDYDNDQCVTFADYQRWYAAYQGQRARGE